MSNTQSESEVPQPEHRLWIVEGELDIPVFFEVPPGQKFGGLHISLTGHLDGFVELRPADLTRSTSSVFTSASKPVIYRFRAGVLAASSAMAFMRASELTEHLIDRLTLITGYPVRLLNISFVYDEEELRKCLDGSGTDYEITTGGEEAFRTQTPKNLQNLLKLMQPPPSASEPIRWFRHAMTTPREIDQYLAYYIALEGIAQHVPGIRKEIRKCGTCGIEIGTETAANAGIKFLISRHSTLDGKTRGAMARIRAHIAHGSTDRQTLASAKANLHVVQRLAADGIALVLGIDPESLQFLRPKQFELLPIIRATYVPDNNPAKSWNGLLSDAFKKYAHPAV